jgi:hypothetical protein
MSLFPFWMRRNGVNSNNSRRLDPFVYRGVTDLDECLYAKDTDLVIPIESKMHHIPDLAWHKLAYPCYRFIGQPRFDAQSVVADSGTRMTLRQEGRRRVVPASCAYHAATRQAMIHVFPEVQLYSGRVRDLSSEKVQGMILNEQRQMAPAQTYTVDMGWI